MDRLTLFRKTFNFWKRLFRDLLLLAVGGIVFIATSTAYPEHPATAISLALCLLAGIAAIAAKAQERVDWSGVRRLMNAEKNDIRIATHQFYVEEYRIEARSDGSVWVTLSLGAHSAEQYCLRQRTLIVEAHRIRFSSEPRSGYVYLPEAHYAYCFEPEGVAERVVANLPKLEAGLQAASATAALPV